MKKRLLLDGHQLRITIDRLCQQLIEHHGNFSDSVILGLQPRGIFLSDRIYKRLKEFLKSDFKIPYGYLDATYHRDDFRHHGNPLVASETKIDFMIENKNVILIDDVLYKGRTVRAGLDAMLAFGRPKSVELLVLIDRRFSRDLPIEAHYAGRTVDTIAGDKVKVQWKEKGGGDAVWLVKEKDKSE